MTVRELTGKMWYSQKIKVVKNLDDLFTGKRDGILFNDDNYKLQSEANKQFWDYEVKSFGCLYPAEIIIVVKLK